MQASKDLCEEASFEAIAIWTAIPPAQLLPYGMGGGAP